ncbi:hypothetical protein D9M71_672800 [compost metagenome]
MLSSTRFSWKPSRSSEYNETRAASFSSTSAPPRAPLTMRSFLVPNPIVPKPSVSKVGFFEITLTAPAVVFLPYSVPCGPRRISMRSRSNSGPPPAIGAFRYTSSA